MTAVALIVRLIHVQQARAVIFFDNLISDGQSYWTWASRLIGGDWIGDEVYYQAPLYPYLLAGMRGIVGDEVAAVRTLQAVVGAIACGLMVYVGRRLFDLRTSIVAGLLLALYPPAIFFDALIQKAVLDGLLMVLVMIALLALVNRTTALRALGVGALLGLLALTRENALALPPLLALWLLLRRGGQAAARPPAQAPAPRRADAATGAAPARRAPRAAAAGALLAGTLLTLAPVVLRNAIVGGEFALTTAQAGPNFYIGNHAGADGTYEPLRPGRGHPRFERRDATDLAARALGHAPTPGEVSRYWFARATADIAEQPGAWLQLLGRKLLLALNWYEVPDAEDLYFYERECGLIAALGRVLHLGVLLPLGVAGFVLALGRRGTAPLLLVAATLLATLVGFYVFARYRYPLVPVLIPFAAFALVRAGDQVRAAAGGPRSGLSPAGAVAAALALIAAAVPANWPLLPRERHLATSLANAANVHNTRGEQQRAIELYEQSLKIRPDFFNAHFGLGLTLGAAGRLDDARAQLQEALALQPDSPEVLTTLGVLAAARQELGVAEGYYASALDKWPAHPEALNALGRLRIATGKAPEGIALLGRAYALAPYEPRLVRDYVQQLAASADKSVRDAQKAVQVAEKGCRDTGFRDVRLLEVLSIAYAAAERPRDALVAARAALAVARARKLEGQLAALEQRVRQLEAAQGAVP